MSYINKSFSHHPLVVTNPQGSPKRVQCHHTHVSCPVSSGHLLAETVVGVFIRSASQCACRASVRSNGRHVTVSVIECCRTIGADVTCGWDEQASDVIVASGGRLPQWCVASGRTTVIRLSVRRCFRRCCTPSGDPFDADCPAHIRVVATLQQIILKSRNNRIVYCSTTACSPPHRWRIG